VKLRLVSYESQMVDLWESFLCQRSNGTFLHTRKYLSYHGDRFKDSSFLVYDGNTLVGLIPIAANRENVTAAISHPGISYGGIIHLGRLLGHSMTVTLELLIAQLASEGFTSLRYKSIPHIYNSFPAQDDVYALHQLGANVSRSYLSSTIAVNSQRPINSKNVKGLSNFSSNFEYRSSFLEIDEFWNILTLNLLSKHGSIPTHSLEEMKLLYSLFKDEIQLISVHLHGAMLAGVIVYRTDRVWHMQYLASSEDGKKLQALDWLIQKIITEAKKNSISFVDFGHSNENNGLDLNSGLYKFKSKFGGGGVALLEFILDLT